MSDLLSYCAPLRRIAVRKGTVANGGDETRGDSVERRTGLDGSAVSPAGGGGRGAGAVGGLWTAAPAGVRGGARHCPPRRGGAPGGRSVGGDRAAGRQRAHLPGDRGAAGTL